MRDTTLRRSSRPSEADLSREIPSTAFECKCTEHLHVPRNTRRLFRRTREDVDVDTRRTTRHARFAHASLSCQGCALPLPAIAAHHLTWGDRMRVRRDHLPFPPDHDHTWIKRRNPRGPLSPLKHLRSHEHPTVRSAHHVRFPRTDARPENRPDWSEHGRPPPGADADPGLPRQR